MSIQKDPEGLEILHLENTVDFTGQSVLEIGCGDGRLTKRYIHRVDCAFCIDPDDKAVQSAKINLSTDLNKKAFFVQANSINLPFPRATFDIALLSWSL
jgi:ubiquinone/menaquinone biosynthesis C-methylase UbiE